MIVKTTLEPISEACVASLDHKTPSVKAETASFLARCFAKCTPVTLPKKLLKIFVAALLKVKVCFIWECQFVLGILFFYINAYLPSPNNCITAYLPCPNNCITDVVTPDVVTLDWCILGRDSTLGSRVEQNLSGWCILVNIVFMNVTRYVINTELKYVNSLFEPMIAL